MGFICRTLLFVGEVVLGVLLGCSVMLSAVALWDVFDRPKLPCVRPLPHGERAEIMQVNEEFRKILDVPLCLGPNLPTAKEYAAILQGHYWSKLSGALRYLDAISPPIAEWVRGRWVAGKIRFQHGDFPYGAAYMPGVRLLLIPVKTLEATDEFLAELLAHEYRHSRQPILPGVQRAIGQWFGVDREDLVEAEAYEFQERVHRALRGQW